MPPGPSAAYHASPREPGPAGSALGVDERRVVPEDLQGRRVPAVHVVGRLAVPPCQMNGTGPILVGTVYNASNRRPSGLQQKVIARVVVARSVRPVVRSTTWIQPEGRADRSKKSPSPGPRS